MGGVQDAMPPHDRISELRSEDGGCGCMAVVTNARAGGGGVRRGIRASALCAASLILGDAGVSGDVAVEGNKSSSSRDGSPREEEGGGGGTGTVTILEQGMHPLVVSKPPPVICNHSEWAGSRSSAKRGEEPDILAQSPPSRRRESGRSISCWRDHITW